MLRREAGLPRPACEGRAQKDAVNGWKVAKGISRVMVKAHCSRIALAATACKLPAEYRVLAAQEKWVCSKLGLFFVFSLTILHPYRNCMSKRKKTALKSFVFFLFLLTTAGAMAQTTVTGSVINASGEPLPNVSVMEKGTNNGTATDSAGNFSLQVKDLNATLQFSSVGYETYEENLRGNATITAVLSPSGTKELEQVVIIGYGTAQKRDLTGSIATVKAEEIANKPSPNALSLLQGKVAGLTVVNNGRPGAEPDVRIRGTNSINGAKPVYIVDGILNDNINFLNPADIESVEVLKDPSSLAIFGVRGANGAIAITTKKAKAGQVNVNLNSSIGFKDVQKRIDLTNGDQFRELFAEQMKNQNDNFEFAPYWTENTDWQDQIFQQGVVSYNNVSISGASEKNKFYLGVGYTSEQGIIKHEQYKKYTVSFNDEFKPAKWITFGINFNGYRADLPLNRDVGGAVLAAPIGPVRDEATGLYHTLPSFQRAQVFNPLLFVEDQKGTLISREYRVVGSIYSDIKFLNNFNFRVQLFEDYGFNTSRSYRPILVAYNPEIAGDDKRDTSTYTTAVFQSQNIYPKTQMDYLLTYKNDFGDHGLTVLAGVTSYYQGYEGTNSSVEQGTAMVIPNDPDKWYPDAVGDPATKRGGGSAWEEASLSYLGRVLYNFSGKYLLNASFRRDGSSQFYALGNAWKNFGAVGAAWVISDEEFMSNQDIFDYLKIKGSWGVLGSKNIDDRYRYPAYPTLTNSNAGVFGDRVVSALEPQYIVSEDLNWESVHSYEFGVEMYLLQNALHFEANYYHKLTKDVLTLIPGPTGTSPGLGNLGEVENKGFEFVASYSRDIAKDLRFDVSGNLTTIENRVNQLNKEGFAIVNGPSRTTAGFPIGYFYGYKVAGVYQSNADVTKSPESTIGSVRPGDLKYADVNGDGKITVDDRTIIGNPTPDFTYGGSIGFTWKNALDLSIDLQGVYGNEIFRTWDQGTFAQFNYRMDRYDRWHGPGTSNWEPILSTARGNNYLDSEYWIEDGSFFRIRNVQLGYTFGTNALDRMGLKNLRVYVNAQNLATFTNSSGYTPEIGGSTTSFGVDRGTYPVPAVYTFGLNLNF